MRRELIAGLGVALAANIYASGVAQAQPPQEFAPVSVLPRNPESYPILVVDPAVPPITNLDVIKGGFTFANKNIQRETNNTYGYKQNPILTVTESAAGKNAGVPCYTSKQIEKFANRFPVKKVGQRVVDIFLSQYTTCDMMQGPNVLAGAQAYTGPKQRYIVYGPYKDPAWLGGAIIHENSHLQGLSHVALVMCGGENTNEILGIKQQDIAENVACGVKKNNITQQPDYYSGSGVMGSGLSPEGVSAFTPSQMNKLMPEAYRVVAVPPIEGDYEITANKNGANSIALAIPDVHPLKKLDASMRQVVFGLRKNNLSSGSNGEETYSINVHAVADAQEYQLPFMPVWTEHAAGQEIQRSVLYVDQALGVVVVLDSPQPQPRAAAKQLLQIIPYHTAKPFLDKQNDTNDAYNRQFNLRVSN